jgi:hypothetical protein
VKSTPLFSWPGLFREIFFRLIVCLLSFCKKNRPGIVPIIWRIENMPGKIFLHFFPGSPALSSPQVNHVIRPWKNPAGAVIMKELLEDAGERRKTTRLFVLCISIAIIAGAIIIPVFAADTSSYCVHCDQLYPSVWNPQYWVCLLTHTCY